MLFPLGPYFIEADFVRWIRGGVLYPTGRAA